MRKLHKYSWLFPNCLLIFLSIYLFVKFIFIFFFSAAYTPRLIFELTPLYLFSGVSNSQLALLSLVVMFSDLYLHVWSGKRRLLFSFVPTALMLSSIGYTIMFNELDLSFVFHYVLFGSLLLVVLIDYHYVLTGVESLGSVQRKKIEKRSVPASKPEYPSAQERTVVPPRYEPSVSFEHVSELQKVSETLLQKMQVILSDLDRKTEKIERMEGTFEERERRFTAREKRFTSGVVSCLDALEPVPLQANKFDMNTSLGGTLRLKENTRERGISDKTDDAVAIVQRGVFKDISRSFSGILGYERVELLGKNFFVFVSPQRIDDMKKYYLSRLKGVCMNSFQTMLLTKNNEELPVEITVASTVYDGGPAEYFYIRIIKK
jgi:PAS domain S-box-containing protein